MPQIELLSAKQHADLKVLTTRTQADKEIGPLIAVIAEELPQLVLDFPVLVSKRPTTGEFELNALVGFTAQENLFVDQTGWQSTYVPLDVQRRPFRLCVINGTAVDSVSEIDSSTQLEIGLDIESAQLSRDTGIALFDADQPSDFTKHLSKLLGHLLNGAKATGVFLQALADLNLLRPLNIEVKLPEGKTSMAGFYSVDAEKLSQLKAEQVVELHGKGYLQACHAMLHSLGHLEKLVAWKNHSGEPGT